MSVERGETVEAIFALLSQAGARRYGDERVSQLEHALQAATLAAEAGETASIVIASLFHDIGHLVGKGDQGFAAAGRDGRHEDIGAAVLARLFGESVAAPVRLHVAAKRYLCHAEAGYWDSLSEGSKLSLRVQGGPFDRPAAAAFLNQPHAEAAIRLRKFDEAAKVPGRNTPDLAAFAGWSAMLGTGA